MKCFTWTRAQGVSLGIHARQVHDLGWVVDLGEPGRNRIHTEVWMVGTEVSMMQTVLVRPPASIFPEQERGMLTDVRFEEAVIRFTEGRCEIGAPSPDEISSSALVRIQCGRAPRGWEFTATTEFGNSREVVHGRGSQGPRSGDGGWSDSLWIMERRSIVCLEQTRVESGTLVPNYLVWDGEHLVHTIHRLAQRRARLWDRTDGR